MLERGTTRSQCKAALFSLLGVLGEVPLFPSSYTGQEEALLGRPPSRGRGERELSLF